MRIRQRGFLMSRLSLIFYRLRIVLCVLESCILHSRKYLAKFIDNLDMLQRLRVLLSRTRHEEPPHKPNTLCNVWYYPKKKGLTGSSQSAFCGAKDRWFTKASVVCRKRCNKAHVPSVGISRTKLSAVPNTTTRYSLPLQQRAPQDQLLTTCCRLIPNIY